MRVFLDTNIIMEYYGHRRLFDDVTKILTAAYEGAIDAVVSEGSLCTMAYLIGIELKQRGIHEPEKAVQVRRILNVLLSYIHVVHLDDDAIEESLNDSDFTDTEDSFQFHCALTNHCDTLVTINLKHFRQARSRELEIIDPSQFVQKYIV